MLLNRLRTLIIYFFLALCAFNTAANYQAYQQILAEKGKPIWEPGYEFAGLSRFLAQERTIGYFTDLNFSAESSTTGNFLSAQYRLAPIVLDVNDAHHLFVLIDASDPFVAFNLAEKLKATPVYFNPHGKLLAGKQTP